jgi:hypothetical protein
VIIRLSIRCPSQLRCVTAETAGRSGKIVLLQSLSQARDTANVTCHRLRPARDHRPGGDHPSPPQRIRDCSTWPPTPGLYRCVCVTLTGLRGNRSPHDLAESSGISQSTTTRAIAAFTLPIHAALAAWIPITDEIAPPGRLRPSVSATSSCVCTRRPSCGCQSSGGAEPVGRSTNSHEHKGAEVGRRVQAPGNTTSPRSRHLQ